MSKIYAVLVRGFKRGLTVAWELGVKVILPVYIVISFLTYTPIIGWLSIILTPLMQIVGLPGEAALPLVLAAFNVYAGIGAVIPLGLSVKELTITCAIILLAHDLPLEAAISKKTGSRVTSLVIIRVVLAFAAAALVNLVM